MTKLNSSLVLLFLVGILAIPVGVIAVSSPEEVRDKSNKMAKPISSNSGPITSAQYYLPRPELVDLPAQPSTYVTEDGTVVLAPQNTIYAEFSGLPSSEILNKLVELVEARDVRWGFAACTSSNLNNTFLPFNEYLQIRFIDDNDTAMVMVDNSELAVALDPWGIHVANQGRLEMSEELLVGEMLLSIVSGDVGMCWGNSMATELIIYGNIQGLFDSLTEQYTVDY